MKNRLVAEEIFKRLRTFIGSGEIGLHEPEFRGNEKKYVLEALESTYVSSSGRFITDLERKFEDYLESNHAIAVSSGTSALHLALLSIGVEPGDEVIVPTLTFIATANAVKYCGANPILLDANAKDWGICLDSLEGWLRNSTEVRSGNRVNIATGARVKAIIPMHVLGHVGDMDRLMEISELFGVAVVEDAAESLGSTYKNRQSGTFGKVGIFSLNGNKTITAGGGGIVVTQDEALSDRIRHLATTAKYKHSWNFNHSEVGYNYRLPNLNAALALGQFEMLDEKIYDQRRLHSIYESTFADMDEISIWGEPENSSSNFWLQALVLEKSNESLLEEILAATNGRGISTRPLWGLLQEQLPFKAFQKIGGCVAPDLRSKVLCLPSSPHLARDF